MSSPSPSPSPSRRVRAGHARRAQHLAIPGPSPTAAVAMKRESSLESSVSASRQRVTKKLKTGVQLDAASATVHLYLPRATDSVSGKLVFDNVVASVSQPKRKRNGHFKSEPTNAYKGALASDASDGGNSSGDEADDEVDAEFVPSRRRGPRSTSSSGSPATDVEDNGGDMTDIDEDDSETQHVEMSIVEHVAPMTPASSTTGSFPIAHTFPWFGSAPATPSSARQIPQESPLHQVEAMLSAVRHRNGFMSSSSDGSEWESTGSRRARKRSKAVERDAEASGVEETVSSIRLAGGSGTERSCPQMIGEAKGYQTPTQATESARGQHALAQGQRILNATVSGVTAGLQALVSRRSSLEMVRNLI